MDPILEVSNLQVTFRTMEGTVRAVNGVSFQLQAGQTLGIVGESGCGKSVTMLSVMHLIPEPPGKIVAGTVNYLGNNLLQMDRTQIEQVRGNEIAMIFQDPMTSFNPVLTIGRQISEVLTVHQGMDQDGAQKRAVELLDLVGIPEASRRVREYPHQFSGGMRQRAMIAMALACQPKILIADEPTTALDVTIQAQIIDLIKHLRDSLGMAVIWITHDLGVVAELADRVAVMYSGYMVEESDVEAIFAAPSHPYTLALLKSLPRIDYSLEQRLAAIPGFPPDGLNLSPGCPFISRCTYAIERCSQANPALEEILPDHSVACWVDTITGRER